MTDDELRDLQEQAHQLNELTRHPGWPVLVEYLHTTMNGAKRAVLNGNVVDFARYKEFTGEFVGIHKAIDAPVTVAGIVDAEIGRRAERARVFDGDAA